jgi:hypothetical protein
MFVEGPGDDDGLINLPDRWGRDRGCRASDFYGCVAPDLETLAENSGARDYQECGHSEVFRKADGSCGACAYEAWRAREVNSSEA